MPNSIPKRAATKDKKAKERTLGAHGARLFNLLPKSLRNENSRDFPLFKNLLDIFLQPFLTHQPPQDWLGLQSQTVCVTRSPILIQRAFLFKSNTLDLTLVSY